MVFLKLFHLLFLFIWVGSLLVITKFFQKIERPALKNLYLTTNVPAMTLAIALGVILFISKGADFSGGWLHMKLTMVFFLCLSDIFVGKRIWSKKPYSKGFFYSMHFLVIIFLTMILFSIYFLKGIHHP